MPKPESPKWIERFVSALQALGGNDQLPKDSAALARLRRGLTNHPAEAEAWVYSRMPVVSPRLDRLAILIACLFARHPLKGGSGSLGAAFKDAADRERMRTGRAADEAIPAVARRFAQILDAHAHDLENRLPQAVSFLKAREVPIDWRRLLEDLTRWNHPRRWVQRQWARDYWAMRHKTTDVAADAAVVPPSAE